MNLTLGTLDELKTHLLNEGLRDQDTWDGALAALGLGVSRRFEQACNRKFGRVVEDIFDFDADRRVFSLPRYPIEEITKIEIRDDLATGFVDQGAPADLIFSLREQSGLVEFASELALATSRVRFTYTAGFWVDTSADGSVNSRKRSQEGSVALNQGDESAVIAFDEEFADVPKIMPTVVPPMGEETIIPAVPRAKTAAGCTVLLGLPIPAAGYTLDYIAQLTSEEDAGGAMPDGATALPEDLKLAWLLQCQLVWQTVDSLGIALSEAKIKTAAQQALLGLKLSPEVEDVLRSYRRYGL